MPGFDGNDRGRGQENLRGLDVRGLTEVGVHTGVLEHVRSRGEFRLIAGDPLEVELRLLDRVPAKCGFQVFDVEVLVRGYGPQQLRELRIGDLALARRLVVPGTTALRD